MMANIFFTSDLHFFHHNIISFCNRPYRDVDEMNDCLVANWNGVVGMADVVYVLGDVSFGKPDATLELMSELNGAIKLIPGNHDRKGRCTIEDLSLRCDILAPYELLRISKSVKFVLCHFPFASWERGWINLHGHTHGIHPSKYMQHDVGVDVNKYRPISVEEAKDKAKNKPVEDLY